MQSKKITRNIEHTISILEKQPRRCSHECVYSYKTSGRYHCNLFDRLIDIEDDEDKYYGFVRAEECVKIFGGCSLEELNRILSDGDKKEDY